MLRDRQEQQSLQAMSTKSSLTCHQRKVYKVNEVASLCQIHLDKTHLEGVQPHSPHPFQLLHNVQRIYHLKEIIRLFIFHIRFCSFSRR